VVSDYVNRMSDRRFEKFDKMILPNNNDKKLSIILTIGLVVSLIYLGSTLLTQSQAPSALKYEEGLNISYSPESSTYFIDYTNPKNESTNMMIDVQIPRTEISYMSVFSTETAKFPANISYKPSNTDLPHTVMVNIIKPNGNYSYFLNNVPGEENKMYEGFYKYTNPISTMVQ
jgi:hypothetical protein